MKFISSRYDIDAYTLASPDDNLVSIDPNFDCYTGAIYILDEESNKISLDPPRDLIFKKTILSGSIEVPFAFVFVDKSVSYTFKTFVRKSESLSDTIDPFLTNIESENGLINQFNSIGVGIGVKFFDELDEFVQAEDYRKFFDQWLLPNSMILIIIMYSLT